MNKVISLIDNVIVETKEKEIYNKLVEEVLRMIEKNNIYIKLEKYKWKILWYAWTLIFNFYLI